ncbi:uncharacterized protein [Periplaneta americana]|uniref:uncharacterized protein n=1 Tax=Periplaneta americana TaxID=6978 RepID=UPI0037E8B2FC
MLKLSVFVVLLAYTVCFFTLPGLQEVEGADENSTSPADNGSGNFLSVIAKFPLLVLQFPMELLQRMLYFGGNILLKISNAIGNIQGFGDPESTTLSVNSR